jgi:hypothetical protein
MKVTPPYLTVLLLLFACAPVTAIKAQDTIVKTNGEIIPAKVLEVGTDAITYKKLSFKDGPTFSEKKTDIALIKYSNGQRQEFIKAVNVQDPRNMQATGTNTATVGGANQANNRYLQSGPVSDHYRIEVLNNRYMVNGQKIGRKELDRILGKSKNPAVLVALKTAKATKIAQKIIGLTSIATTTGGGVTSVVTIINCFRSPAPSSYLNAGLSLVGTMSLPITSKILKKRRDKLYDKTIDLYNATN